MANRILTESGWEERIRSKLGVDKSYLPDDDIQQPDNIVVAESNIIKRIPDYEGLTGDDRTYLEAAVICECAARICPSMPARLPKREQGPSIGHELNVDWKQRKIGLELERDGHVSNISTFTALSSLHCFRISSPS